MNSRSLLCVDRDRDKNGSGMSGGLETSFQVKAHTSSIMYTQLNFVEFVALFRSFSLRARKDLRDLFGQLAITCRSQSDGSLGDFSIRPTVLRQTSDATPQRIGWFSRNSLTPTPRSCFRRPFSVLARVGTRPSPWHRVPYLGQTLRFACGGQREIRIRVSDKETADIYIVTC